MKNREVEMGFNLFHLISDVYHRENLHSDIMEAIISPSGSHGQGDLFLRLFLDFLRKHHHVAIKAEDYRNAKVVREKGRIDLLIYDDTSRKAIIVENKINGAPDMHRQLVRYLENVADKRGYTCQAIVYLCLNQRKHPDQHNWLPDEKKKVKPLLRVVCAYDDGAEDVLHTGWLTPCIDALETDDADACTPQRDEVIIVLRQYRQLIRKLGLTLMNKPIMETFYQMMRNKPHHDSAMAVASMVNHLPTYRRQKVLDTFGEDYGPFDCLDVWGAAETLAFFRGLGEGDIKLHVECADQGFTKLEFWNAADDDPQGDLPRRILSDTGMVDSFSYDSESGWFTKVFRFPAEEDELYQFLHDFKEALNKRTSAPA
jgi:hypothetical protein